MKNVSHWFELPAEDLDRAKLFYESVFGFELVSETNGGYEMLAFPMDSNSFGSGGALMKGFGYKPSLEGPIVYLSVDEIDEITPKIESAGGKIFVPKKNIGEYGFICIFGDSEGNRVGLYQSNFSPSAK